MQGNTTLVGLHVEGNRGFVDTLGFLQPLPAVTTATTNADTAPPSQQPTEGAGSVDDRATTSGRTAASAQTLARGASFLSESTTWPHGSGSNLLSQDSGTPRRLDSMERRQSSVSVCSPVVGRLMPQLVARHRLADFSSHCVETRAQAVGVAVALGHVATTGGHVQESGGGDRCVAVRVCVWLCACACGCVIHSCMWACCGMCQQLLDVFWFRPGRGAISTVASRVEGLEPTPLRVSGHCCLS